MPVTLSSVFNTSVRDVICCGLMLCSGLIHANDIQANDWLASAQQQAAQHQDAAALITLWQSFSEHSESEQQQALVLAADLCARNGLLELARSYYLRLLTQANQNPLASGDRYAIARFFADQREWQRVVATLEPYWQRYPTALKRQAQTLLAFAQLKLGQPEAAAQNLQFKRHSNQSLPYRRYNLAIARHRLGQTFEARQILHRLVEQPVHSREQSFFRDAIRINLAQHYLSYEQGRFAQPLLQDIQIHSPFANRALLFLGWAALTPGGEQPLCQTLNSAQGCWIDVDEAGRDIQRSQSSISETFAKLRPTQGRDLSPQAQVSLTAAIRSWLLLANNTQAQPQASKEVLAYLEGNVSLAYALQIAQQQHAALKQYQTSLTLLDQYAMAPNNLAYSASDHGHYLRRLNALKTNLTDAPNTPAALQQKIATAIDNAMEYRRHSLQSQQDDIQRAWQAAITEYRKQALLGLASLHEQMSFQ